MSKKLLCPNCKNDVSLNGHEVFFDGEYIQSGGCCTIPWEESCPNCGKRFLINVIMGPVEVIVQEVMEAV